MWNCAMATKMRCSFHRPDLSFVLFFSDETSTVSQEKNDKITSSFYEFWCVHSNWNSFRFGSTRNVLYWVFFKFICAVSVFFLKCTVQAVDFCRRSLNMSFAARQGTAAARFCALSSSTYWTYFWGACLCVQLEWNAVSKVTANMLQCTMWQHAYITKITKSSFDGLKVDFGSF